LTPYSVYVHFTVNDTGIVIPAERLQAVFEPFTQVDGSLTRRHGGTGLGLTLSRRLIEMMGGRIWAESQVGTGSEFHCTAYFRRAQASPTPEAPSVSLAGLQVLLISQHTSSRDKLVATLQELGAKSVSAPFGERAIETLRRYRAASQ